MKVNFFLCYIALCAVSPVVISQQLIEDSKLVIQLRNGLKLTCYKAHSLTNTATINYYYLPVNMHFSKTERNDKAYSIMLYRDADNEVKGGIMHWILSWGINQNELNEARDLLHKKIGEKATLVGAVLVEKSKIADDFEIKGKTELSEILNMSLVNRGQVPLMANSKMAIAFKFTKNDALEISNLFANYLEQKKTEIQMLFSVNFIKSNGRFYKKNWIIHQNLRNLFYQ